MAPNQRHCTWTLLTNIRLLFERRSLQYIPSGRAMATYCVQPISTCVGNIKPNIGGIELNFQGLCSDIPVQNSQTRGGVPVSAWQDNSDP